MRYFHNGKPIGEIAEPGFAQAFFGIWLDPKTSRADFREKLLGAAMTARGAAAAAAAPARRAARRAALARLRPARHAARDGGAAAVRAPAQVLRRPPRRVARRRSASLLLVLRLADGVLDPLLGAWSDRAPSRKRLIALAAPVLAVGMVALFSPPAARRSGAARLARRRRSPLVYVAFSLATINHGAWGAELSRDPVERTRITAVREALALVGVVIASVAPASARRRRRRGRRTRALRVVFAAFASLACAAITLAFAPAGARVPAAARADVRADWRHRWRTRCSARLLAVFMANGIASAIPATLVLFFIADVLQAEARQGLFLALYFVAGAAGMPLWVRLSARVGKVRAWHVGDGRGDRRVRLGREACAKATSPRSRSSARRRASRSAPTSRCRRRCSPT